MATFPWPTTLNRMMFSPPQTRKKWEYRIECGDATKHSRWKESDCEGRICEPVPPIHPRAWLIRIQSGSAEKSNSRISACTFHLRLRSLTTHRKSSASAPVNFSIAHTTTDGARKLLLLLARLDWLVLLIVRASRTAFPMERRKSSPLGRWLLLNPVTMVGWTLLARSVGGSSLGSGVSSSTMWVVSRTVVKLSSVCVRYRLVLPTTMSLQRT